MNGQFTTKQEYLLRMRKKASALVYHAARYIDHSPSLLKQVVFICSNLQNKDFEGLLPEGGRRLKIA